MNYKLIGDHPEDTAEGAVLAPGETTDTLGSFDPENTHNKRLIDEGKLIEVPDASEPVEVNATDPATRLAEANGIELAGVTGTGSGGRIIEADVEREIATRSAGRETS